MLEANIYGPTGAFHHSSHITHHAVSPFAGGLGSGLLLEASFGRFDFNGRYANANQAGAQPAHAFADYLLGFPVSTSRATSTSLSVSMGPRTTAAMDTCAATAFSTVFGKTSGESPRTPRWRPTGSRAIAPSATAWRAWCGSGARPRKSPSRRCSR